MNDNLIIAEMELPERVAFLQSFIFMIRSDGKIEESEVELIADLVKIYRIPKENFHEINQFRNLDQILETLKTNVRGRTQALFLIKELLTIANIDDELADAEIAFVEAVSNALAIEDDKVLAIHELLMQRMLWLFNNKIVMEYNLSAGE